MLRGKCYSLMRKPAPTIAVETGSSSKSHTQFASSSVDSDQDAGARENRPFSALIPVLKHREIFVWKSFGNRVTKQANAISSKPRLCPDRLDSPRIGARQEIFQRKRGYVLTIPRRKRGTSRSSFERCPFSTTDDGSAHSQAHFLVSAA